MYRQKTQSLDGLFEGGDGAAFDAEDVEEFVPEGLGFGAFFGGALPLVGKGDGALADFVPGQTGHGWAPLY